MKFPDLHPAVIGTVTSAAGLRLLAKKALPCDAVEVRVDALLKANVPAGEISAALAARQHPVLLTLRIPAEGGHRPWKIAERRSLFLELLPHVDAIDIELATAKALAPVLDAARKAKKTIVYSAHALKKPATSAQFANWVNQFVSGPRSILKVAAQIKSWRDLQQLAAILVNHPDWHVAVMGLGPAAAQSRSVLAALGSRLVYGYLDLPAAPGQPSAADVRKMLRS
jgi:3-dehydroquinate dehydratase-1